MTVDTTCPNCGTLYTLRSELIGKRTKCTRCGTHFTITETAHVPTSPPAAPVTPPTLPPQPVYTDIPTHLPPPTHVAAPTAASPARRPDRTGQLFGFEADASNPRFPAMRMVARAYEIMAVAVLAFAAPLLVLLLIAVIRDPSAWLAAMFSFGVMFATAFVTALMFLFAAQAIRLGLQIEQNTRETQQSCHQLAEHFSAIEHEP